MAEADIAAGSAPDVLDTATGKDGPEATSAPEQQQSQPITYDESLLIIVKGKIKRPERPDNTERDLQVQKLQEEIDKAKARVVEINATLDAKSSGQKGSSPEQQEARAKLQSLRGDWQTVLHQKKQLQAERGDAMTERDKLRAEQRALKEAARGALSLEAIEERLAELEFKLTHESLSASDEKRLRESKERLARSERPAAVRYAELSAKVTEVSSAIDGFKARIAELDVQLNGIKAGLDGTSAALDGMRAAEAEARSDVPALVGERKELRVVVDALIKKQREIREAFNAKWDTWKAQDRAFKGWLAADRQKRSAERKKEYDERQAARKAAEKASRPIKWDAEVVMCEQALAYLAKFVETGSKEATGSAAKAAEEAPAPGMKLLKKKGDEEELGGLFGVSSAKKGKGAKREAARAAAATAVSKGPQKLNHTLDSLNTFMRLGVEVPNSSADVPRTIEAITAKKTEYEAKRAAAEDEPEEVVEEEAGEEEEAVVEEEGAEVVAEDKEAGAVEEEAVLSEAAEEQRAEEVEEAGAEASAEPEAVAEANGDAAAAADASSAAGVSVEAAAPEAGSGDVGVALRVSECGTEVKLTLQV